MKNKLLGLIMGVMILVGALTPTAAFACDGKTLFGLEPWYARLDCVNGEISQSNFQGSQLTESIISIIGTIVADLLFVGGFVAVGMLIYAGIQYATSAGDPGKVAKASKTISASIIGLIICILGYAIIKVVFELVGENV